MPTRLTNVVFDSLDCQRMAELWSAALQWPVIEHEPDPEEGWIRLDDGPGLEVIFVPNPEPKTVKNRAHLDLWVDSDDDQQQVVNELIGLGASPADIGQRDVPWTVLADPEGNEFCVATAPGPRM